MLKQLKSVLLVVSTDGVSMLRVMSLKFKTPQRGFTLLEVLIAIVVLAVGLLGVAAMQVKALKSAHLAYQRSIATLAAQDAVEQLWVELAKPSDLDAGGSNYPVDPGVCPDDTAINQIEADWKARWGEHIPMSSESTIENPSSSPSNCLYVVSVNWNDERFDDDGDGTFDLVSSLSYVVELPGR